MYLYSDSSAAAAAAQCITSVDHFFGIKMFGQFVDVWHTKESLTEYFISMLYQLLWE